MLVGKTVTLRAWQETDLTELARMRNDVALQSTLMTQPRPNSFERVQIWLSEKTRSEDTAFFVIASSRNDRPVGYVQVVRMRFLHGTGELGICLPAVQHRKGYGSESVSLLGSYLQRTFGIRKLWLNTLADNSKAVSFFRGCGFEEAGRLRSHVYCDGTYRDVLLMEKMLPT